MERKDCSVAKMAKSSEAHLSLEDCMCPICCELLLEPVTLPCNHTLCNPCFQLTVEKANLCCPLCRQRVSTWARYHARNNTLIDRKLWDRVQKAYPEECQRRAAGQEEVVYTFHPPPKLSEPGELREEYEAQLNKAEAERQAREEEERKASEEYIQKLLAEEEEERELAELRRKEREEQFRLDEELARSLSNDMTAVMEIKKDGFSSPARPAVGRQNSVSTSKRSKRTKKTSCTGDIERYLSLTATQHFSQRETKDSAVTERSFIVVNGSASTEDIDSTEMPTLTPPQALHLMNEEAPGSSFDRIMPKLSPYKQGICDALETERVLPQDSGMETREKSHRHSTKPSLSMKNQGDAGNGCIHLSYRRQLPFTQGCNHKGTEKLKVNGGNLENFDNEQELDCDTIGQSLNESELQESHNRKNVESCDKEEPWGVGKRKRGAGDMGEADRGSTHMLHLMEQEKQLYEKHKQEEEDWQLALKIQKKMDQELKNVNRKKGSPDEYLLRPKCISVVGQENVPVGEEEPPRSQRIREHKSFGRWGQTSPARDSSLTPTNGHRERNVQKSQAPAKPARTGGKGSSNSLRVLELVRAVQTGNKQQTTIEMLQKCDRK
ncbi:E3 ubiquitin-protein ligase rnf168 isoform X2 [Latimeria chalumnae]|uniref:E3 ubiquitin-protein ligase rnf168 isoform X2 n=1 Tax=Latimeria chalumnae TaxID=7897 RepID=UPI00313E407E